jgi:valyl-tRNA synthetase
MFGKNACWVPGTDHASIATEAKVVQKLRSEGIKKGDLTRKEFLEHAWEWTDKHGGVILNQLKKLGASCDWERTNFTMNDDYYKSVINVFCDLHEKGLIYRGERMINWDPQAKTALSDEEVFYKEVNSKLYYVRYKISGSDDEWIQIATTRPETILGDTAICINPNDERYKNLKGKEAVVPLVNRSIPIIFDEYVDMEFGTGCLKITPAHDPNDYEIGKKHNLEVINILDASGKLNKKAKLHVGEDRFDVRKSISLELEESGYLIKIEDHINKIGFSERTDAIIEPRLSLQWFCSMDNISKPALENVMNDTVQFHPAKFKNTYRHWMENIRDWCISRQLWWGHQIPAFFYGEDDEEFIVAPTKELALEKLNSLSKKQYNLDDLKQDEDVMDTWFSSWIWPIAVFNGFSDDKKELNYYFPTNDLVTAPEIMFFWVARMIISGYEYENKPPFKNVYFTGIVRDQLGRKMSKSLGNSPDPLELIKKYGADGVRVGMLLSSPAGNDLLFDSNLCEQGRNFTNKLWNSFRLIQSWTINNDISQEDSSKIALEWIESKIAENIEKINDSYDKFRISEALMITYKTIWDDYCSWFLEMIKPAYQQPIDVITYKAVVNVLESLLKIIHPFTPFIAEEIWQQLKERNNTYIVNAKWPDKRTVNNSLISEFQIFQEIVMSIRNLRKEKNISNKVLLELKIKVNNNWSNNFDSLLVKLCNLSSIDFCENSIDGSYSFIVKNNEFFVPFTESIDADVEISNIKAELVKKESFLKSVLGKLNNSKFMDNAPQKVVELEEKKKDDAEKQIKILEERLKNLSS